MAAYFLDSSALVKRYVQEVGTSWVRGLARRGAANQIILARITAVEVTSAIARRRQGGSLTSARASLFLSRFRRHLAGRYVLLDMTPSLLAEAMNLANIHELRAYDAVQPASALRVNRLSGGAIVLVSSDQELNKAAAAEGLTVVVHGTILRERHMRMVRPPGFAAALTTPRLSR